MKAVNQLINYECGKYERVADLILTNKRVRRGMKQFGTMNYQKNEFVSEMNQVMSNYMSNQPDIMQKSEKVCMAAREKRNNYLKRKGLITGVTSYQ